MYVDHRKLTDKIEENERFLRFCTNMFRILIPSSFMSILYASVVPHAPYMQFFGITGSIFLLIVLLMAISYDATRIQTSAFKDAMYKIQHSDSGGKDI